MKEAEFQTFVNPGIPIRNSHIHHITDYMVANAPSIEDVLPEFLRFVGNLPVIAHNAERFDIQFLTASAKRMGIDISLSYGDSLRMAKQAYSLPNYKLATVANSLGIPTQNQHRAMGDVMMLGGVVRDLLRR